MTTVNNSAAAGKELRRDSIFYRMAWRWHFYAGLFVIPFLLMLSVTGIVMLYDEQIQQVRYNGMTLVQPAQSKLSANKQLAIVESAYPQAQVKKYLPGKTDQDAAFFVIKTEQSTLHIALNPFTGEILGEINRDDSWYALANDIHGSLLLGEKGDLMIEIATGFIILLSVSGLYLWFGNKSASGLVFWPTIGKGKKRFYKQLHSSLGFYCVGFLLLFALSGLSWSGVWGAKLVQAWNSFPAQKWSNIPLSELDHSSMNQGVMEEVPWNLEQTPLPNSRASEESSASLSRVDLDRIVAIAAELSMQQYQINLPSTKDGVYTLSADTMSGDISDPRLDRTVHIDQYSGEVLTDVGWEQYSLMAKLMAAGIGLHQGGLGWVNLLVNTLLCIAFIAIAVSGLYLWWLRKPSKTWSLNAPKSINTQQPWYLGGACVLAIGILFPLSGAAIACFVILDAIVYLVKEWMNNRTSTS